VGEYSQLLKKAFGFVQQGKSFEAAIIYMQLAEMGFGVAALNLGLLLERIDVFQTENTILGQKGLKSLSSDFNINKQLAMKYFQLAQFNLDTDSEASLKIAEFLYYGTSGHVDYKEALSIYKSVEDTAHTSEVKGHALF
jgi:TPR repeat protein